MRRLKYFMGVMEKYLTTSKRDAIIPEVSREDP